MWIKRPLWVVAAALSLAMAWSGGLAALHTDRVFAYDKTGAADNADQNALRCNDAEGDCFNNDCTAFVPKALSFGGGYNMTNAGNDAHDYHNWWEHFDGYWVGPTPTLGLVSTTSTSSSCTTVPEAH